MSKPRIRVMIGLLNLLVLAGCGAPTLVGNTIGNTVTLAKTVTAPARQAIKDAAATPIIASLLPTPPLIPTETPESREEARVYYALAQLYQTGTRVPQDQSKAFRLYAQAANHGSSAAFLALGRYYAAGESVPRDDGLAVTLVQRAADGGTIPALTELGRMLERGQGVPADPKAALALYTAAAEAGDADAQQEQHRLAAKLPLVTAAAYGKMPAHPAPAPATSEKPVALQPVHTIPRLRPDVLPNLLDLPHY